MDLDQERLARGLVRRLYLLVGELVHQGVLVVAWIATGLRWGERAVEERAVIGVYADPGAELEDVVARAEQTGEEDRAGWGKDLIILLELDADGPPGDLRQRLGVLAVCAAWGSRDAQ